MNLDLEIYYTTDLPPLLITSKWVRFVRVCGNSQKLCRASCKVRVIKSVLCKRLTDEIHSADYGIFHLGNPLRHHFNEIILEHSPYLKYIVKTIICTNTVWYSLRLHLLFLLAPPINLWLDYCKRSKAKQLSLTLLAWKSVNRAPKSCLFLSQVECQSITQSKPLVSSSLWYLRVIHRQLHNTGCGIDIEGNSPKIMEKIDNLFEASIYLLVSILLFFFCSLFYYYEDTSNSKWVFQWPQWERERLWYD